MTYKHLVNRDSILIFLMGILVFTIGLSPEFTSFQARFALFVQNIYFHGITFFPTTYHAPYADYPATSSIIIYLVSRFFGKLTMFTAVLPTAIVSSCILVCIYRIGSLHYREWGIYATLFALFTEFFFSASRSITPDQYTSLATILCFYLAYSAEIDQQYKRLFFIPFVLIFSFAFRGPIGLVIPAGVICGLYLINKDIKKILLFGIISALLLVSCTALLLFLARLQGGQTFMQQVISGEVLGRLSDATNKSHIFYYWTDSFGSYALTFPIAILVILGSLKNIVKRTTVDYKFLAYLTMWFLVIMIGMSIPGAKKTRYILPIVPAISLIAGYLFIDTSQKGLIYWLRKICFQLFAFFPLIACITVIILAIINIRLSLYIRADFLASIITLSILMVLSRYFNFKYKFHTQRYAIILMIAVISFIILNIHIIEPINYSLERTKPFVSKIEVLQKHFPKALVFYQIGPDAEDIKFMVNLDKPIQPTFIQTEADLLELNNPSYFIAIIKDFNQLSAQAKLKYEVLFRGKIGHRECLVFTQRSQL